MLAAKQLKDICINQIEALSGLRTRLNTDPVELKAEHRVMGGGDTFPYMLDHERNELDGNDFCWLQFIDKHGVTKGRIGRRVFSVQNFLDEVVSFRLFSQEPPEPYDLGLYPEAFDLRGIGGRVELGGALLLAREYRGLGLKEPICALARSVSFSRHKFDYAGAFFHNRPEAIGMASEAAGLRHRTKFMKGIWPGSGGARKVDISFVWSSRVEAGEWITMILAELQATEARN